MSELYLGGLNLTQLQIVVGFWFVIAMVIMVSIWLVIRDILTHAYYQKKSEDGYMVAEFLSKVTPAFTELVKIENRDTGEFHYKGRQYFCAREKVQIAYPPGRSKIAQVNMDKCYPNAASADMATNLYGKPTVDAVLVGASMQQKDTAHAMDTSKEDSMGGKPGNKNQMWMWIALGLLGVIGCATLVFIIKGQGIQEATLTTMQKIADGMGVK